MLPRNQPSPVLCWLLVIGLAWPAPTALARPAGLSGDGDAGLPGWTSAAPTPRLLANPSSPDDHFSLVAAGCDLDDAEETDDPPAAKRPFAVLLVPDRAGLGLSIRIVAHPPRRSRLDPKPACPRPGLLRC